MSNLRNSSSLKLIRAFWLACSLSSASCAGETETYSKTERIEEFNSWAKVLGDDFTYASVTQEIPKDLDYLLVIRYDTEGYWTYQSYLITLGEKTELHYRQFENSVFRSCVVDREYINVPQISELARYIDVAPIINPHPFFVIVEQKEGQERNIHITTDGYDEVVSNQLQLVEISLLKSLNSFCG